MSSLHEQYRGYSIDQLLQALELSADPGSPHRAFLENLLAVRTAEMVNKQLAETARVTAVSTNTIKATLENSSEFLICALKVSTETSSESAAQIGNEIVRLSEGLAAASIELKEASSQSSRAAARLNNLTLVLAVGSLLLFLAACFQGLETKRQVDLAERQLRFTEQQLKRTPAPTNK